MPALSSRHGPSQRSLFRRLLYHVTLGRAPAMFFLLFPALPFFSQPIDFASPYRFLNIGKAQGLEGTKPTCVFQDSYGFVWIGTWGGLYRFDGNSCRLFEHKPGDPTSLPSNFIAYHAFYEDKNRDLWIATYYSGFVKFDRNTEKFEVFQKAPNQLLSDAINALYGVNDDTIWIATRSHGLSRYSPKQNQYYNYAFSDKKADTLMGTGRLMEVCNAHDGTLWIGTLYGAASLDKQGHFRRYFPDPKQKGSISGAFVVDIFEDKKGQIWLSSNNGLNCLTAPGYFTSYHPYGSQNVPKDLGYNNIQRVFQDKGGDFWLGTIAGLLRFDPNRGEYEAIMHHAHVPTSIAEGGVHGIFEDNRGHLWFAADAGLSLLDKRTALLQDKNWAAAQAVMPSINTLYGGVHLAETNGRIWVATDEGLYFFNPGQKKINRFPEGKAFTALFLDSKGRMYAGTNENEFFVIDPKSLRVLERFSKNDTRFRDNHTIGKRNTAFAEDLNGKIWIGTFGTLHQYDPQTRQYQHVKTHPKSASSISNTEINDLHVDRLGNLWIATMDGVNMLSAAELDLGLLFRFERHRTDPQTINSISNNHVRAICEDKEGRLWFGTDAGLNLFDPRTRRWKRFFREDGIPENTVTGIVEDKDGNIWVTTPSQGIAKYVERERKFLRLTKSDGMNSEQFPSKGCFKLSDGRLVFAGVGGLNVFDPSRVLFQIDSVPLYFTELKLFNRPVIPGGKDSLLSQPIYMTRKVELGFEQNVLTLQVAALNFVNPEKQAYRFRLEGFAQLENWQTLGTSREITLTNLFPGTYTLRVESTTQPDDREHWESAAILTITVKYPWGSILLAAAILLTTLYIIYKLRLRRKLAAAEARRLIELDAVKTKLFTSITHEFRTPLTVILGEITQLEKHIVANGRSGILAIRRQGKQLLHLVSQILDSAKLEAGLIRLNMVQGDVILFLKYLLESFHSLADDKQIELRFETDTDEFWMDYDADKLQKIVSNLLSNALKFTPNTGCISLLVATNETRGWVQLRVSDNGRGISPEKVSLVFDRFFQVDDSSGGTGIGLTLSKELVHLLGGQISVESPALGGSEGTTFIVALPVTRLAGKQLFSKEEFFEEDQRLDSERDSLAGSEPPVKMPHNPAASRPQLLLVEDNADVARYIASLLAADYNIHLVQNGKEGLEAAYRLVPDLVISDVMMPEMNGFEVCRTLKTDLRTSHIPIILLTAKADMDSRVEGLEHGADAYLAKPFEERELRVQLRKLHELRQALRERYAKGFDSYVPSINPAFQREDAFFQKLHSALEQHYSNPDFGVPGLCDALYMARATLYRKLTALANKNIEDYLRSFRLNKALEMLRTTDKLVNEVGWDCGFKEQSSFTRAFKDEFGIPPSEARS